MRRSRLTLCALLTTATLAARVWAGDFASTDNSPSEQQAVQNLGNNGYDDEILGSWTVNPPIPTPNGTSQTTTGSDCFGQVYVIGGGTGSGPDVTLNLNLQYSPLTATWTTMAPVPGGAGRGLRAFGSIALVTGPSAPRELFYIFGGYDGVVPINTLNIYNTTTNSWSTGAAIPATGGGFGSGVCQLADRIFVVGGSNNFTAGFEYHVGTNTYTNIAPMGSGGAYRTHCAGVESRSECHCFGNGFDSNQHFVYHADTNTWTNGPVMPLAVTDPAVVSQDDKVYVMGGTGGPPNARTQIFDANAGTWTRGPDLPSPLNNTSGTMDLGVVPATIYVEGGYDGVGSVPFNYSWVPSADDDGGGGPTTN